MNNLKKTRQKFIWMLAILGVVDLLLIVYLLLPGSSPSALAAQEKSLQEQANTLEREVKPLRGIDKQLAITRVDVKKFYEQNVPSQYSQISQHLEKLMQETGVTADQGIRYSEVRSTGNEKNDLPDVQRVAIDTTVTGEYSKVARLINAMEQDKFLFIIDEISLGSHEGGTVSLKIKCETFLRKT